MSCKSKCASDSLIEIYKYMCDHYEGQVNPLRDIHTMPQLACMRTDFSLMVYKELSQFSPHDQLYLLEILSKVRL